MNRREFLALSFVGFGALFLPPQVRAAASAESLKTSAGQLLGRPVNEIYRGIRAVLGPGYTVLGLHQSRGTCFVRVSFQGHAFSLKSTDFQRWHTADWTPPSGSQTPDSEDTHG